MKISRLFCLLFIVLTACGRSGGSECNQEKSCSFGETCVNGFCDRTECNTSLECPMESYCSKARTCVTGCESSSDCLPGSTCNMDTAVCEERACTETALDCGFREFCNLATGECYDAGAQYCRPCTEDFECGSGNYCFWGYCGVDCSGGKECPGGFECFPIENAEGQTISYQCLTYCWLYEDYEPGSFLKEAGPKAGDEAGDLVLTGSSAKGAR
jgi:hypothetical protein